VGLVGRVPQRASVVRLLSCVFRRAIAYYTCTHTYAGSARMSPPTAPFFGAGDCLEPNTILGKNVSLSTVPNRVGSYARTLAMQCAHVRHCAHDFPNSV